MKNIFLFISIVSLFINDNIIPKSNSGEVLYEIKSIEFDSKEGGRSTMKVIDEIKKNAEKHNFTLLFNETQSKFHSNNELTSESGNGDKAGLYKMAAIRFTCDFNYYIDKTNSFTLLERFDGTIIKGDLKDLNWNITKESKSIGEYTCYKAIHTKKFIGRDGKDKTSSIIAWFSPSLPYSYGPKEYNGLPGLILELQDRETTFLATKINFTDQKIIDFPKKKSITEDEFRKKMLKK